MKFKTSEPKNFLWLQRRNSLKISMTSLARPLASYSYKFVFPYRRVCQSSPGQESWRAGRAAPASPACPAFRGPPWVPGQPSGWKAAAPGRVPLSRRAAPGVRPRPASRAGLAARAPLAPPSWTPEERRRRPAAGRSPPCWSRSRRPGCPVVLRTTMLISLQWGLRIHESAAIRCQHETVRNKTILMYQNILDFVIPCFGFWTFFSILISMILGQNDPDVTALKWTLVDPCFLSGWCWAIVYITNHFCWGGGGG